MNKTAIDDIANERNRQRHVEGWSTEHDDQHTDGAMARAAACYIAGDPAGWPWARKWWRPKDRRQDLIRAGALIVAEIERLDRKTHLDELAEFNDPEELRIAGEQGRAAFKRACATVDQGKDPTAPVCERCGAKVHDPCTTAEAQSLCQLPDFCFPDRANG